MSDLEYIENTINSSGAGDAGASDSESGPFFPSLEYLKLEDLPKLKGWWRYDKKVGRVSKQECCLLPSFPRLLDLRIWRCSNLMSVPLCPTVERLNLGKSDKRLHIMESESRNSTLTSVYTEDIRCLESALSVESFQCLGQMEIRNDQEVKSLSEACVLFQRCSSSLRSLIIDGCPNLKSLCGGLVHLTALVTLHITNLPRLSLSNAENKEDEEVDGMPWRCLNRCLRSLSLEYLPKLVNFPKGMQYLTTLQSLSIKDCAGLRSLPEFIRELISLVQLEITGCSPSLKKRCRNPTGEDWPNIQHIPHILTDFRLEYTQHIPHISITKDDTTDFRTEQIEDFDADFSEANDSEFSSEHSSVHCL